MVTIRHNLDQIGREIGNLIQSYAQRVERDVDQVMGEVSADFDGKLKGYTPVDVGSLWAAWERSRVGYAHYEHRNPLPYAVTVNYGGYLGVGPKTHSEGPQTFPGGISVEGGIFPNQRPSHMVERSLSEINTEIRQKLGEVLSRKR